MWGHEPEEYEDACGMSGSGSMGKVGTARRSPTQAELPEES